MFWTIILLSFVTIFLVLFIGHVLQLSGQFKFDQVVYNLRELRYQSLLLLTDSIIQDSSRHNANSRYREFMEVTARTIEIFDRTKSFSFNYNCIKMLLRNIERAYRMIENGDFESNRSTNMLKSQFIWNLHLAFRVIPLVESRAIKIIMFNMPGFLDKVAGVMSYFSYPVKSKKIANLLSIVEVYKRIFGQKSLQ